MSVSQKLKFT